MNLFTITKQGRSAVLRAVLAAVVVGVGAGAVFAQRPTLEKLQFVPVGASGFEAKAIDVNISGDVVIPAVYNGKPVTRVSGFTNCAGMRSVVIPENVSVVAKNAFYGCSGLTDLVIPASVTRIEDYGFQNCGNLTSVAFLGSTVDMNAKRAFDGDLVTAHQNGGAGTYTRAARGGTWTRQAGRGGSGAVCPTCGNNNAPQAGGGHGRPGPKFCQCCGQPIQ